MTNQLRTGIEQKKPEVLLSGEVELDELYGNCWFQGSTERGEKKGRRGRIRRLKAKPGRGTLAQEKPPIFGMMQRSGEVVLKMLSNVKQATIAPVIQKMISLGTLIYTDEYSIYARLTEWGYAHKTVNHEQGEYARDDDGDGFCEVHVNCVGRLLVIVTLLVTTTSGDFSRQTASLFGIF